MEPKYLAFRFGDYTPLAHHLTFGDWIPRESHLVHYRSRKKILLRCKATPLRSSLVSLGESSESGSTPKGSE